MSKEYTISFYHDRRRGKEENTFPLKLRLYHAPTRKEKLFRTGYDFTKEEFDQVVKKKPSSRGQKRVGKDRKNEITEILHVLRDKADKILKDLPRFSFEAFDRRYYNKSARLDIVEYYEVYIENLKEEGRIRSAETYQNSLNRLKAFFNRKRKKPIKEIPFESITPQTLKAFEDYYLKEGRTLATIGFYLRALKAVFNQALNDPNSGLKKSIYPFGKFKYQIPTGRNAKRALSKEQLKTLFYAEPKDKYQEKAKAFWFFSYLAQGMNIKDIALLQFKNIIQESIFFSRAKTQRTTRGNPVQVQVPLQDKLYEVIKKYGRKKGNKEEYIFPIISNTDTPEEQARKIKAFTRFINQHIKRLALANGLPGGISTYWARHTYTTKLVNEGNPLTLIQQNLGHKSIKTTQSYISGFPSEELKRVSETLLNFD